MFLEKDRIKNPPKLTDNVIAFMIVVSSIIAPIAAIFAVAKALITFFNLPPKE